MCTEKTVPNSKTLCVGGGGCLVLWYFFTLGGNRSSYDFEVLFENINFCL